MPVNLNVYESPSMNMTVYQVSIQELLSLNVTNQHIGYITKGDLKQELYSKFTAHIKKQLWDSIEQIIDEDDIKGYDSKGYSDSGILLAAYEKFPFLNEEILDVDYEIFKKHAMKKIEAGFGCAPDAWRKPECYKKLIIAMNDRFNMTWEEIAEVVEEWSVDTKMKEKT